MSDGDETQIASSDSKKNNFKLIKRKWNEGETTTLTELLEERECFHKTCFQKNLFSYLLYPRIKNQIIKHIRYTWDEILDSFS